MGFSRAFLFLHIFSFSNAEGLSCTLSKDAVDGRLMITLFAVGLLLYLISSLLMTIIFRKANVDQTNVVCEVSQDDKSASKQVFNYLQTVD